MGRQNRLDFVIFLACVTTAVAARFSEVAFAFMTRAAEHPGFSKEQEALDRARRQFSRFIPHRLLEV